MFTLPNINMGGSGAVYWEFFMSKLRPLDVCEVNSVFRIKNGNLEKFYKQYNKWKQVIHKVKPKCGYYTISLNGRVVREHRIIWVLYNNSDINDNLEIDHINGNTLDNRIENLRAVSHRENNQNMKKHRMGGLPGVNYLKNSNNYQSRIKIGKLITLGYFNDIKTAYKAYVIACDNVDKFTDNKSFRKLVMSKL